MQSLTMMLFYFLQLASYMKAVNDIYDRADFDGIQLVNFKVKFLTVRNLFCIVLLFLTFSFVFPGTRLCLHAARSIIIYHNNISQNAMYCRTLMVFTL